MFNKIKRFFDSKKHIESATRKLENNLLYKIQASHLVELAMTSTTKGVQYERYAEEEVVVSLTTYGKRLYEVAPTIESIMQGSIKPNRIILWLEEGLKDAVLPEILKRQQQRGLEIGYCKDLRSYKKLIPSLEKYPEAIIITIDDDAIYGYDLLENLLISHAESPNCIIGNRIHRIILGDDRKPKKYNEWELGVSSSEISSLNFFTGVGGVLYPPNSLDTEVLNADVFFDICKYADDIWFYAMALKRGTNIKKGFTHDKDGCDYILNEDVQDMALYKINTKKDNLNDIQFRSVFEKYNLYNRL